MVRFGSEEEYRARRGDAAFWTPHVRSILERHGMPAPAPVAGFNATYPTFLCDGYVVKLFGYAGPWRRGHAAERAAYATIADDPLVAAPAVVAQGALFDDEEAPWPYLITTCMHGVSWPDAGLDERQGLDAAAALGEQVRRIHGLAPDGGVPRIEDWNAPSVAEAAQRSSLPPHLVEQSEEYVARLGAPDRVFVHGDLCANHVFFDGDRYAGIIDWGDALVADRHIELIQIYRECARRLGPERCVHF